MKEGDTWPCANGCQTLLSTDDIFAGNTLTVNVNGAGKAAHRVCPEAADE